ncbi:hypothetical protein E7Z59_10430 [Robertkochia marina]|uniref:Uncharacterized protein n=1 Tax=Robertkochia marina TaxID=1227945 RepID=A0A4S3M0Y4_9FLAO|nr:hypothetical protein [Robertkochia marina]THD68054.1 hypothetical protein E7Z59_10430 [Robertkochia marina]TRZ42662.1 hypothetical protein D3A96_11535 [Robertkochia marina]
MILKSLKDKAIDKRIRRELQREGERYLSAPGDIRSLAIIIDYDKLADIRPLLQLATALNVANEKVFILGYVEKVHKSVNYLIPVFSEATVKGNGLVRSNEVQDFLSRNYDLLINYYGQATPVMKLMTVLTRASFKVGLSADLSDFNDLTLLTEPGDFENFRDELVKYLKILSNK